MYKLKQCVDDFDAIFDNHLYLFKKTHTHTIYTYFSREFVETILKSLHLLSPPVLLLNQESFEVIIPNGFANVFFCDKHIQGFAKNALIGFLTLMFHQKVVPTGKF